MGFQKKGKSSEFNPQDYEKVQSSPALTVWSHGSVKDCRKNLILGQKHKIFKNPRTKTEVFLDCNGQNLFRTIDETSKNQTVWPQQSSKKKEKVPDIAHFPRPGQNYPYMGQF